MILVLFCLVDLLRALVFCCVWVLFLFVTSRFVVFVLIDAAFWFCLLVCLIWFVDCVGLFVLLLCWLRWVVIGLVSFWCVCSRCFMCYFMDCFCVG